MNPLAAMNAGAAIKSALSGGQRMAVGGGHRVPSFGPTIASAPTRPSSMSVGSGGASPGIVDMLSRSKRTRSSGISKTAGIKGAASLPPGGSAGSSGPGVGGGI